VDKLNAVTNLYIQDQKKKQKAIKGVQDQETGEVSDAAKKQAEAMRKAFGSK